MATQNLRETSLTRSDTSKLPTGCTLFLLYPNRMIFGLSYQTPWIFPHFLLSVKLSRKVIGRTVFGHSIQEKVLLWAKDPMPSWHLAILRQKPGWTIAVYTQLFQTLMRDGKFTASV